MPLTLPMGWKNSPPIFCTATETVADLENASLHCNTPVLPHRMDGMAESIFMEEPPTLKPALAGLTRGPYLRRANTNPDAYIDVFVDNFTGISQGRAHWWQLVWKTFFHSLDKVFRPCDSGKSDNCKEVLSLKKLSEGDCMWST